MTWTIIGHRRAVRSLQRAVASGTLTHAYLITGPAQIGKRTLARELAAALNCDAPPRERPCHGCRNCRMTAHEQHPDLIVVERSDGRKDLRVEDVRAARASVDWRPYQGRYKVYLFVDADEMNPAAANALLKTLEEPPPLVVHVLTASQAEAVPPTVLSRCRVLPLQPLSVDDLAAGLQELHGAEPDRAGRLAALSGGRAGWAIAALSAPELVPEREAAVDRAVALSDGPLSARLLLAGEVCKGESFVASRALCLHTLEDMQLWWRDLLLVATGSPAPPVHRDRRAELERQAAKRGRERIVRGLREIELTAGAVERNVTPRLALEALLLRLN
jgi:DNA polymerase III subunit delta'